MGATYSVSAFFLAQKRREFKSAEGKTDVLTFKFNLNPKELNFYILNAVHFEDSSLNDDANSEQQELIAGPVTIEPNWGEITFTDGTVLKRIKKVRAEIKSENLGQGTHTTGHTRKHAARCGKKGDVAGYFIARVLGGRGDLEENIVPIDSTIENRDFREFKFEIRDYLKERLDRRVVITALPRYHGKSVRPYEIKYKAEFYKGTRLDDKARAIFQNE